MITKKDLKTIKDCLLSLGVKNSDFPKVDTLTGDEYIAFIYNNKNYRIKVSDLKYVKTITMGEKVYKVDDNCNVYIDIKDFLNDSNSSCITIRYKGADVHSILDWHEGELWSGSVANKLYSYHELENNEAWNEVEFLDNKLYYVKSSRTFYYYDSSIDLDLIPLLISGVNIKTINGQSLLGSEDIHIEGGSGTPVPNAYPCIGIAYMGELYSDRTDEWSDDELWYNTGNGRLFVYHNRDFIEVGFMDGHLYYVIEPAPAFYYYNNLIDGEPIPICKNPLIVTGEVISTNNPDYSQEPSNAHHSTYIGTEYVCAINRDSAEVVLAYSNNTFIKIVVSSLNIRTYINQAVYAGGNGEPEYWDLGLVVTNDCIFRCRLEGQYLKIKCIYDVTDTTSLFNFINELSEKQDALVSGENIKTINGASILGEGDLEVQASVVTDNDISQSSDNPVKNRVIATRIIQLQQLINEIARVGNGMLPIDGVLPSGYVYEVEMEDAGFEFLTPVLYTGEGGALLLDPGSASTNPKVVLAVEHTEEIEGDVGDPVITLVTLKYYTLWTATNNRYASSVYTIHNDSNSIFTWMDDGYLHIGVPNGTGGIVESSVPVDTGLSASSARPIANYAVTNAIASLATNVSKLTTKVNNVENNGIANSTPVLHFDGFANSGDGHGVSDTLYTGEGGRIVLNRTVPRFELLIPGEFANTHYLSWTETPTRPSSTGYTQLKGKLLWTLVNNNINDADPGMSVEDATPENPGRLSVFYCPNGSYLYEVLPIDLIDHINNLEEELLQLSLSHDRLASEVSSIKDALVDAGIIYDVQY